MSYEKLEQLYEGKAKKVFATSDPNVVIVSYKDDATAFNGLKKGTITGKGAINNRMTNNLMRRLEEKGVPTHYVEELSDRETAVKKVSIVPLEVIIRNISAGSFAKRFGVEEGIVFDAPTIEFSYKNDDLGDPLMNSYHALALKLATQEEIDLIKKYAFAVNDLLRGFMKKIGIDLVDFKLEFGKTSDGTIVLADEISPDTCRLWDEQTHEKLDKDRFRRDMGGAEEAYEEVMRRLMGEVNDVVVVFLNFVVTKFAPFAVFVLLTRTFAIYGVDYLKPALVYVVTTVILLFVFLLVGYPTIVAVGAKLNPFTFIKKIANVAVFGFSTSSSAATLPLSIKVCTEDLGVDDSIASFVLPLGMTINMDGTAIMQVIATVFIAGCAGYDLTPMELVVIALLALLASVGTPAAPGAGAVILFTILSGVGFVNDKALLAYSLILAINRPIEMLVTSLNVVGDATSCICVAKSEGMLDEEKYNA